MITIEEVLDAHKRIPNRGMRFNCSCGWTGLPLARDWNGHIAQAITDAGFGLLPSPLSSISPDCRDANHHKCRGDAWDEAHDHITECQCSCHTAAASVADGIIGRNLTGLLPGHTCVRPGPGYPLGVIWQCLLCKTTYRMESVRDRGISQNEWTPFEVAP